MRAFALVDCNNFYVSCERAFNPQLWHKPVVVLSNNDGCIIARSEEAKAIGIKMGLPHFKARDVVKKHGVQVFSSNYALYGHMSRRVMGIMGTYPVEQEVYSIDESFLKLPDDSAESLMVLALDMKEKILSWTGIPVSVGIGSTKTLAKLANRIVKSRPGSNGVVSLLDMEEREAALKQFPVGDVWGVGRNIRNRLLKDGIQTAAQLRDTDSFWLRKQFGVKGLAVKLELQGEVCSDIKTVQPGRKEIIVSRTFGSRLGTYKDLEPAFRDFAAKGTERLATARMAAGSLTAFVMMDRYRNDYEGGSSVELILNQPSSSEGLITMLALDALRKILTPGREYKKGGIILGRLSSTNISQPTFFDQPGLPLNLVPSINTEQPKSASDKSGLWEQRKEFLSPRYTSQWSELPLAR